MDHGSPTKGSIEGMLRRLNAGDSKSVYDTASIPGFSIGNNVDLPQATRVTDGGDMGSPRSWGRCRRSSSPTSSQADPRLGEVLRGLCQPDLLKYSEGFLPEDSLDELLQLSTVKDELRTQFPEDDHNVLDLLARRICYRDVRRNVSYRRTFAISCLVDDLATIKTLLDPGTGICDDDLPLMKYQEAGKDIELRKRAAPHTRIKCFRRWHRNQANLFDDWQWTVLAPTLGCLSGECPELNHRVVLPLIFKSDPSEEGTNGGFSDVFKIQVHPRHHEFSPRDPNRFFALKRFKSADNKIFEQELRILRKFNSNNAHPHIVSLLTAWRQGEHSYFLFPWAESDLLRYWELHSPLKTPEFVRWVAQQTAGLADGLAAIHEYGHNGPPDPGEEEPTYGRHGDITPENILWFKAREGYGSIVISDFGFGAFHRRQSRSEIPNSGIACTPTYRPPECDMRDGKISRSWDIWILGCVYVEFATWLQRSRQSQSIKPTYK